MKRLLTLMLWALCTGLAISKPANFTFTPGKSFGPVHVGQSLRSSLAALKGWTWNIDQEGYASGRYYTFPKEQPGVMVQFILGFNPENQLRDVSLYDRSCVMQGHPEIHLGCTRKQVEAALGPCKDGTNEACDYRDLGIQFNFASGLPPRAELPYAVPKFAPGQCDLIMIYRPGYH